LPFIAGGLALSAVSYFPLYNWMEAAAHAGSYVQIVIAVLLQLNLHRNGLRTDRRFPH
jgi:hypothetical protein